MMFFISLVSIVPDKSAMRLARLSNCGALIQAIGKSSMLQEVLS